MSPRPQHAPTTSEAWAGAVEQEAARTGFSGVVRVDLAGSTVVSLARGLADRAHGVPNTVDTVFGTASGTKTLTALTLVRLAELGTIGLGTTARSVLGADLPLIGDDVTVEHLLAHRSGIGDYVDEEAVTSITDHVMPVPVHELDSTPAYLPILDGHPTVFPAGQRYAYNNGGYVVLALVAERAAGTPFADLVRTLVCEPAGMVDTAFLRLDELPGRAARGYLAADGLRSNVLHLPVLGSGDGGAYTTVADVHRLWAALPEGRVVSEESLAAMLRPSGPPESWAPGEARHGMGFHLAPAGDAAWMEGADAGVSFLSRHKASTRLTWTVVSNWSDGAWPVARLLRGLAAS